MEPLAPIVDETLAREVFAVTDAADAREFRRMFNDCIVDLLPRLERLRQDAPTIAPQDAARQLHQLRGVLANFALARAAQRLRTLEYAWDETRADARAEALAAAANDIAAGRGILRETYSFLNEA